MAAITSFLAELDEAVARGNPESCLRALWHAAIASIAAAEPMSERRRAIMVSLTMGFNRTVPHTQGKCPGRKIYAGRDYTTGAASSACARWSIR